MSKIKLLLMTFFSVIKVIIKSAWLSVYWIIKGIWWTFKFFFFSLSFHMGFCRKYRGYRFFLFDDYSSPPMITPVVIMYVILLLILLLLGNSLFLILLSTNILSGFFEICRWQWKIQENKLRKEGEK